LFPIAIRHKIHKVMAEQIIFFLPPADLVIVDAINLIACTSFVFGNKDKIVTSNFTFGLEPENNNFTCLQKSTRTANKTNFFFPNLSLNLHRETMAW
jgi:hypothetical protein